MTLVAAEATLLATDAAPRPLAELVAAPVASERTEEAALRADEAAEATEETAEVGASAMLCEWVEEECGECEERSGRGLRGKSSGTVDG